MTYMVSSWWSSFFFKKLILDTNLSKVLHCIEPGLAYVSKTKTSLFFELYTDSHESRQKSFIIRGGGGGRGEVLHGDLPLDKV